MSLEVDCYLGEIVWPSLTLFDSYLDELDLLELEFEVWCLPG